MSRCDIEGVVTGTENGTVNVETVPAAACAGCAGRMLCGSGRILRVQSGGAYLPGERVKLSIPHSSGLMISAILYGGGTALGVLFAALAYFVLGAPEVAAALIFIVTELGWFSLGALRLRGFPRLKPENSKGSGFVP
mgnify:CR=1 FL=1